VRVVRVLRIPLEARANIQGFIDRISKAITTPSASISVKGDVIRVELIGPASLVNESILALRSIIDEYKPHKKPLNTRTYTSDKVEKLAGVKIPIDTLEELLKLKGYTVVRKTKRSIDTNAPLNVIEEYARKLGEVLSKIRDAKMSRAAKKSIIVASAFLDIDDPMKLIEECLAKGMMVKGDDGRIKTWYTWRGALREIIKTLKQ